VDIKLERRGGREPLYDGIARLVSGVVRIWIDLRVTGAERIPRTGPVLLAANHVSYVDPVVLGVVGHRAGRRLRFLALSDLFDRPVVGWVLRTGRMLPVFRGAGPQRMTDAACDALEDGEAVLVYPEGHITPHGRSPGQLGAGLLALRTTASVVPLCSAGLERRDGRHVPQLRQRAGVAVGPPVDLAGWRGRVDREACRAASEAMLDAVYALLPVARSAAGRAGEFSA